jgi:uncharacterized protein (DUF2235 family)
LAKNIVICSDGTGNTFADGVSNVSRLVRCLDLAGDPRCPPQVASYDQGIGTNGNLIRPARDYKAKAGRAAEALTILDPPATLAFVPARVARWAGMAFGWGLEENVFQIVQQLTRDHQAGDRIYLFGFSRGAFTVRVVAGLLYRCGLPPREIADFPAWFHEAYEIYEPHERNREREEKFKDDNDCKIVDVEFLGLWDTVKSYGGLRPKSLPHLRHNPIVKTVRHALALQERRAWFAHTTWGHLQEPLKGIPLEDDPRYVDQSIQEVWFRGCHSDVGGGDAEWWAARAPLCWMLAEAARKGLRINDYGWALLHNPGAPEAMASLLHESYGWGWRLFGLVPRVELFNDERPPRREWSWLRPVAARDPMAPMWRNKVALCHESAVDCWKGGSMEVIATVPPERPRELPAD